MPDLKTFIAGAFALELGFGRKTEDASYPDLALEEVAAFVRLLGPPPRKAMDDRAKAGERIFTETGCAQCHQPSLQLPRQAEAETGENQ